ncbi:hypothetical protein I204_02046 [Kwoniella mangroviensis CBS 8886]|uniref:uncharacterized protein n=1 Tax=Kwoniella mangroviensis CBS 8507 TaxID=1296122 RepID=UPI00080D65B4|nr:uncharacterized protein I203_03647 [Kwoniella mangroviensis CBS 8507]OCF66965.1 hypothetical protein I203_03647 [Kwoniella mangroviensis CBS 8507]OCF78040.1 hypothetical protein I204_02046 [Kwoniella mangroviensis CBS 8886]
MSSDLQILILGASGYIGGTLLVDLLKEYKPSSITTLVREDTKKSLLEPLGVNVVVGNVEDATFLQGLASQYDVIVNFAVPFGGEDASIQALVDGLEQRASSGATKVKPVLLQTSGTGSIMYGSNGETGTDVWKDSDHERWEALPDNAFFHSGDRIISKAAARGIVSAYIVMSPTVYGQGTGPGNKLSLQVPAYVRYAKRAGQAAYIGKGENIWGNVHVQDLTDLYVLLMKHSLSNPESTKATGESHGWSNLIYAGLNQHTWGPIIKLVGDQLHARGDIANPGAKSIEDGQGEMYMFGTNSFMEVSEKARALGWKQRQPSLEDAIKLALPVRD